ncbi:MAG: hypothetical protein [crAssphage sp. isolate ctcc615]|uniref:Uncharacterized protein n=1 Tax=crAssphage sp. isolate ctcc615 TaxID=2989853 RepID=A0A345BNY1_9CAUD|nr:MAG: hypothetical protein KNU00_gp59 [crAssphage sp. isolate ctcc615]AXF52152.1 MAG: hypothetical protein [crAssphage sp. isolate ctcc615]
MDIKTDVASSAENPIKVPERQTPSDILDEDLSKEYIDKRTIIISLVHNYSTYRRVNMKVLGQRKETIGSSISSCRILSSNAGEVNAYFPALVGLSPNHADFTSRVKAWLSNIQFIVNENDVPLDISFIYKTKKDYLDFKKKEEAIDDEYAKVDRSNISLIKEAIKRRVDALNTLESEKYKVGRPVNLEQYIIYRHCLLYKDVAKDIAIVNSDPSIRFYIKDEAKEAEKEKKRTEQRLLAMRNFIELNASPSKKNAVYVAVVAMRNENVSEALLKSDAEKSAYLMDFVNSNPEKFNKAVSDKNITTKAFIETLIVRGELVRSEFNQQISTADGTLIGSNMNGAVAFFNNPDNKDMRELFENKLKMF